MAIRQKTQKWATLSPLWHTHDPKESIGNDRGVLNRLGLWLPAQVRPEYKLPVPRRPVPDYSRFADRPRWLNDGLPVEPGKHGAHGLINVPRCAGCGGEARRREPTAPELSPLQLPP